jgi:hypothetical protein
MTRRATIVVEQLNHTQWHAIAPGRGAGGVGNYVVALSDGLTWGVLDGRRVETVALDGTRLLMTEGGPAWAR